MKLMNIEEIFIHFISMKKEWIILPNISFLFNTWGKLRNQYAIRRIWAKMGKIWINIHFLVLNNWIIGSKF